MIFQFLYFLRIELIVHIDSKKLCMCVYVCIGRNGCEVPLDADRRPDWSTSKESPVNLSSCLDSSAANLHSTALTLTTGQSRPSVPSIPTSDANPGPKLCVKNYLPSSSALQLTEASESNPNLNKCDRGSANLTNHVNKVNDRVRTKVQSSYRRKSTDTCQLTGSARTGMSSTLNHSSTTKSPDSLLGSFFNPSIPHSQMVSPAAITASTPLPKSAIHSGTAGRPVSEAQDSPATTYTPTLMSDLPAVTTTGFTAGSLGSVACMCNCGQSDDMATGSDGQTPISSVTQTVWKHVTFSRSESFREAIKHGVTYRSESQKNKTYLAGEKEKTTSNGKANNNNNDNESSNSFEGCEIPATQFNDSISVYLNANQRLRFSGKSNTDKNGNETFCKDPTGCQLVLLFPTFPTFLVLFLLFPIFCSKPPTIPTFWFPKQSEILCQF